MHNKQIIRPIYLKKLGKYLKEEMKKKGLSQYDISFTYSKEDVNCIDSRTVRGILKGSRNMTVDSQTGFQESLGIRTPKDLFFPNEEFCISLITEILEVLKTDSHFENSLLRRQLLNFLNRRYGCNDIKFDNFEKNIIDKFIVSLLNLFPAFPNEESSYEISEKISDWLIELACLLSEL
ncbi:hypothetical protein [Streptococcus gordonii]|jgi:hypothetical protein|uniref:hypothetical protein n=1 Tax=Streptococcus gordonii TaxID=1302 RepID=UPI000F67D559|nr:hypothetical protein [Streptococcus gordonii]MCC3175027.1 hypothetical protein [Streptococcus gordonii]RSJ50914.1 hypothetical protein D8814_07560 [Streptococcus gordonii]